MYLPTSEEYSLLNEETKCRILQKVHEEIQILKNEHYINHSEKPLYNIQVGNKNYKKQKHDLKLNFKYLYQTGNKSPISNYSNNNSLYKLYHQNTQTLNHHEFKLNIVANTNEKKNNTNKFSEKEYYNYYIKDNGEEDYFEFFPNEQKYLTKSCNSKTYKDRIKNSGYHFLTEQGTDLKYKNLLFKIENDRIKRKKSEKNMFNEDSKQATGRFAQVTETKKKNLIDKKGNKYKFFNPLIFNNILDKVKNNNKKKRTNIRNYLRLMDKYNYKQNENAKSFIQTESIDNNQKNKTLNLKRLNSIKNTSLSINSKLLKNLINKGKKKDRPIKLQNASFLTKSSTLANDLLTKTDINASDNSNILFTDNISSNKNELKKSFTFNTGEISLNNLTKDKLNKYIYGRNESKKIFNYLHRKSKTTTNTVLNLQNSNKKLIRNNLTGSNEREKFYLSFNLAKQRKFEKNKRLIFNYRKQNKLISEMKKRILTNIFSDNNKESLIINIPNPLKSPKQIKKLKEKKRISGIRNKNLIINLLKEN